MGAMRVAVIDVGSNTLRLLVADLEGPRVAYVRAERAFIRLGEDIERTGSISPAKLESATGEAAVYARLARQLGAQAVEILVTAPGRQSENAEDLVAGLEHASGVPVRVLSADEEGRLAYEGAVAALDDAPASVAVCDLGGGSTEIVVGTPSGGPAWVRSFDFGSLRLTRRHVSDDPPGKRALAAVRSEVAEALDTAVPPLPKAAVATGGTARALGKMAGGSLGEEELEDAVRKLTRRTAREIAKRYPIDLARARTLPAGAVVLVEVQRRLETPLVVSRAGIREGAALGLAERAVAAA
jgi:exopolyphosphatase / guanosine-5'-triphosphate,3'-diphosphate pyrophosphatase